VVTGYNFLDVRHLT